MLVYGPHAIKDVPVAVKKAIKNRNTANVASVKINGQQNPPNMNFNYPQQALQGYSQQPTQGYPQQPRPPNWMNYPQNNPPWNGGPPFQGAWNPGWGNFFPMPIGPINQFGPRPGFPNPQLGNQPPQQQVFPQPQGLNASFNPNLGYQQNSGGGNNSNWNSMQNQNTNNTHQMNSFAGNQNNPIFNNRNQSSNNGTGNNLSNGYQTGNFMNQKQFPTDSKSNISSIICSTANLASNTFPHLINQALKINNGSENAASTSNQSISQKTSSTTDNSRTSYQTRRANVVVDDAFERNFQKYIMNIKGDQSTMGSGYQQNTGGGAMRSGLQNSNRTSPFKKPQDCCEHI